jgi:glycosyltransferase involved in cell wall biosynthesis
VPEVVHVISTPAGVGGAETVIAGISRYRPEGWRHRVLNPFAQDGHNPQLADLCSRSDMQYTGFACRSAAGLPAVRRWLAVEIDRTTPAVVHAHLFHALALTASLRWAATRSYIATFHHADNPSGRGRLMIDQWSGRRYHRLVAVSDAGRRFLLDRYRYPPAQVEVIRNGWDGSPQPSRPSGRGPTVVCVANFRKEKGHDVLIAAHERVVRALPDARLVLVGDGAERDAIAAAAARRGISEHVTMAGYRPDVWAELARADVFVMPSHAEPLGIALLEAMAAGLPVVATEVGGIPEIVTHDVNGLLFPPGDDEALAEHLLSLLGDSARRARLGAAGVAVAADNAMSEMAGRYAELYSGLSRTG